MTTPKFKAINLKRSQDHDHPDIKTNGTPYLAKFYGSLHFGTFSRQWYGLHFACDCSWGVSGMQYDAPGTNYSAWEAVWELTNEKKGLGKPKHRKTRRQAQAPSGSR